MQTSDEKMSFLHWGCWLLGSLCIAMPACAESTIYITTQPDGTPYYTQESTGESSRLYLTQGTPSARPRMPRLDSERLHPRKGLLDAYDTLTNPSIDILIETAARLYGVPHALLLAVMHAESHFNPNALSPVGAVGLMQIMPPTGARYGVGHGLSDPVKNIDVGARYLKDLLELFKGDVELAVAAYNSGEGAVLKYRGRIPPYPETRAYVPKVMRLYLQYRQRLSNR